MAYTLEQLNAATADEAASVIESGDTIVIGQAALYATA